jgi:hypothetical protein
MQYKRAVCKSDRLCNLKKKFKTGVDREVMFAAIVVNWFAFDILEGQVGLAIRRSARID